MDPLQLWPDSSVSDSYYPTTHLASPLRYPTGILKLTSSSFVCSSLQFCSSYSLPRPWEVIIPQCTQATTLRVNLDPSLRLHRHWVLQQTLSTLPCLSGGSSVLCTSITTLALSHRCLLPRILWSALNCASVPDPTMLHMQPEGSFWSIIRSWSCHSAQNPSMAAHVTRNKSQSLLKWQRPTKPYRNWPSALSLISSTITLPLLSLLSLLFSEHSRLVPILKNFCYFLCLEYFSR